MLDQTKTFDLRNTNPSSIRYDITPSKTVSDLTAGILHLCTYKTPPSGAVMSGEGDADCAFEMCNSVKDTEYDKPLIEELVIDRLNVSVVMLRYAIGGDYARFPTNLQVNIIYPSNDGNEESMPLEVTELDSAELYSLNISDNYTVVYNDKTVLKLERERGWYYESNFGAEYPIYLDKIHSYYLPSKFILARHTDSLGILKGPIKFNLKSSAIAPSGFYRSRKISDELADFLGHPKGATIPLTDVTREIYDYISKNNLVNNNLRKIILDKKLSELLKLKEGYKLNPMDLLEYLNPHLQPVDKDNLTVMYDGNKYYYVILYTDDYSTDDFIFKSIRRWRVTQ